MNVTGGGDEHDTDRNIARLLEAAGPREELPKELESRWETHFRAELASARRARRCRYGVPLGALAASIVALALVLDRSDGTGAREIPMQVLAVAGSGEVQMSDGQRQPTVPGLNLSAGAVLETGSGSRLALSWAGFDVRLNEHTRLRLLNDRLQLQAGELFISDQGQRTLLSAATVETPIATVRDIGTQFKVRYEDDKVTTSVREGSIVVETEQAKQRVDAESKGKRALVVSADGSIEASADWSDWTWIYPVARRFDLEGRSVVDYLRWFAAETGREVRFADEAAELAAGYTRFSGAVDVSGLDPEQAVDLVLSTTRFEAKAEGNALLVSRRSE